MGKCRNCNLEVLDETDSCPLCRSILDPTDPLENMYPNVRVAMRRLMLISRIYLFCAILLEFVLFCVNLISGTQLWWSAITGIVLLYIYTVLRFAILGRSDYMNKIGVLALIFVVAAVLIDFVTGYRGWSVDFVLPAGLLLMDLVIIACMIVNRRNWQSYLLWQITMVLCSLVPAILFALKLERLIHLALLPLGLSCSIFLGTMIIGGHRARAELKRRFHVN